MTMSRYSSFLLNPFVFLFPSSQIGQFSLMITSSPSLTVRLTNRTSDPCRGFLGGIVKCPEEIAVGVDAMSGLITASSTWSGFFCIRLYDAGRTLSQKEEAGRMYPEEVHVEVHLLNCVLRCLAFLAPLPRPLMEKTRRLLHH